MTAVIDPTCAIAAVSGADLQVPLVQGGTSSYANFDYAASAPALKQVTDRISQLLPYYASVHRGAGYASPDLAPQCYEASRGAVARFLDADDDQVVVFTRNTTDSLNLLAGCVPAGRPWCSISSTTPTSCRGPRTVAGCTGRRHRRGDDSASRRRAPCTKARRAARGDRGIQCHR